jgi:hypothetical protein
VRPVHQSRPPDVADLDADEPHRVALPLVGQVGQLTAGGSRGDLAVKVVEIELGVRLQRRRVLPVTSAVPSRAPLIACGCRYISSTLNWKLFAISTWSCR